MAKPIQNPELVKEYTELLNKAPYRGFDDAKLKEKIEEAKTKAIPTDEVGTDEVSAEAEVGTEPQTTPGIVGGTEPETVEPAEEVEEDEEVKENPAIELGNKGQRFQPKVHNSHVMKGRRGQDRLSHDDVNHGKR
jgi:hypothetical protein